MNAVVKMPDSGTRLAVTPMDMLQMAVSQGADLDKLEKLMALQERWEANEARKAFNEAMGEFKAESITVNKDSDVSFGTTKYSHASLGNICNVIGAALARHGLSYRWNTQQTEGKIKVTCVISHRSGHSESVSLEASADASGGKNNIQAIGSTVSYLERYTLLAATGTATENQDDDGAGGKPGMVDVQIDAYIAEIEACLTKDKAKSVWENALKVCQSLNDVESKNKIKAALVARLEFIDKAGKE